MNLKNNAGYAELKTTVKKWKEIFVKGINHPHELDAQPPEKLFWEDIIFKGKLDAIDICLLTDKAIHDVGLFSEDAALFLHGLPYYQEVIELIPELKFCGNFASAEMPNGDQIAFLPKELDGGGTIVRTYLKLKQPLRLGCDVLILMDNVIAIIRYVEELPEEYYAKKEAWEQHTNESENQNITDDLPF